MPLYVRKISRAKWESATNQKNVPADAITGCLRTKNNTLSFWEINHLDELDDAVLAIVCKCEKPESIDIIYLEKEKIEEKGFQLKNTIGDTFLSEKINTHFDIEDLNYSKLAFISSLIIKEKKKERIIRYGRKQIKEMIKEAITNSRIEKDMLKDKMIKELEI